MDTFKKIVLGIGIASGISLFAIGFWCLLSAVINEGNTQAEVYLKNCWKYPYVIDKTYHDQVSARFYSEGQVWYVNFHQNGTITVNHYPRGRE